MARGVKIPNSFDVGAGGWSGPERRLGWNEISSKTTATAVHFREEKREEIVEKMKKEL